MDYYHITGKNLTPNLDKIGLIVNIIMYVVGIFFEFKVIFTSTQLSIEF